MDFKNKVPFLRKVGGPLKKDDCSTKKEENLSETPQRDSPYSTDTSTKRGTLSPAKNVFKSGLNLRRAPSKSGSDTAANACDYESVPGAQVKNPDDSDDRGGKDTAKGKYAMKSIVGLLTTASVVVGMGDQQQAKDVAEDLDGVGVDPEEFLEAKSDAGWNLESHGRSEDEKEQHVDTSGDDGTEDFYGWGSPTLTSRGSGFGLSVEPTEKTSDYISSLDDANKQAMIDKLVDHFKLDKDERFMGDFSSFLLKDVLIQGQIFLTSLHLLFFAYLPSNSDEVQLSGNLNVHSRLKGSTRYWAVLRDQSLSLYSSPTETYFPELVVDLKTTASITAIKGKRSGKPTKTFKIETKKRSLTISADSEFSAKSWVNSLRKQYFAAQNANQDSVSLKVPLVNVTEIADEPILEHASTIRVKAVESSASDVKVEFVFVFLDDTSATFKRKIDIQLESLELSDLPTFGRTPEGNQSVVSDSTGVSSLPNSPGDSNASVSGFSPSRTPRKSPHIHHLLPRFSRPQDSSSTGEKSSTLSSLKPKFENIGSDDDTGVISSNTGFLGPVKGVVEGAVNMPATFVQEFNTRMPSSPKKAITHVVTGVGSWSLLAGSNDNGGSNNAESKKGHHRRYFRHGLWNKKPIHYRNSAISFGEDDPYLAAPDESEQANERFREHFRVSTSTNLLGAYFAHLSRNIPIYGKVYISEEMMGFRSLLPGTHTKMYLPLVDVDHCYKEQGFSFGYEGLILVVRDNDELCFEFSSAEARDDAERIILKRIEVLKSRKRGIMNSTTNVLEVDPHIAKMKLVEDKMNAGGIDVPLVVDKNPYFEKAVKPPGKKLRIGLLTIGSRGDVQPYVAFGKGLQKEGHEVVIITHGEFRDFVESRGIGFDEIAGNPADLMSLMVEHESLNVGLLKDAASHFRSWIVELLKTAWDACKRANLDVLVESPSAMAGIHISEALQIPYFRAFTMPWTRTRAYPHAFIVPDQPKGGSYNYMTHVLFENIFWKGISGQVNKWRVQTLKLPKTNLEMMQQNKVPFLYNVSPTIFPPAIDFCEWIKVTGYWFLDEKQSYDPPPDLVAFIAKAGKLNKKLVYIGFGSIVVPDAKELTRSITEAVLEADVYCILNKGWSDRLSSKSDQKEIEVPLPESIFNVGSVPHDWLFPQVDAAVHHGGSGTTGASLKAGCSTIIKPFFGDQYFYATRVQDTGAGIALKKLNSKSMARALIEATHNEKMKARALEVKEHIANEDGVRTAINCLYTELEYAKSLVVTKAEQRNNPKSRFLDASSFPIPSFPTPKLPDLNLEKNFTFL